MRHDVYCKGGSCLRIREGCLLTSPASSPLPQPGPRTRSCTRSWRCPPTAPPARPSRRGACASRRRSSRRRRSRWAGGQGAAVIWTTCRPASSSEQTQCAGPCSAPMATALPPRLTLLPVANFSPWLQAAGGVNVVVKAGQASVQLQDAFHVPLLELCLGAGAHLPPFCCGSVVRWHGGG